MIGDDDWRWCGNGRVGDAHKNRPKTHARRFSVFSPLEFSWRDQVDSLPGLRFQQKILIGPYNLHLVRVALRQNLYVIIEPHVELPGTRRGERLRKPRGDFENPTWDFENPTWGFWKPHVGFWKPHVGFLKTPRGILKTPRGVLVVHSVIPRHQTINVLPPSNEQQNFFSNNPHRLKRLSTIYNWWQKIIVLRLATMKIWVNDQW